MRTDTCRRFRRLVPGLVAVAACWALRPMPCHGQITLTEVTRYNLFTVLSSTTSLGEVNPNYIGNNASAVAWSGSRLFIAGLNNTGGDADTGVIEVLNTATTGIVVSTSVEYGPRFGALFTPNTRLYTGLAISNNRVFATYDDGQPDQENALVGYDVTTPTAPTKVWNSFGRGSAGVAMDPGYVVSGTSQGGAGVGWGTFGDLYSGSSRRRALNDPVTGAAIYGFQSDGGESVPPGFEWNSGGFPRDLSFDPETGDVYGRVENKVIKAVRTGTNSAATPQTIWSVATGLASQQNIAFLNNTTAGDLLVFNNRPTGTTTQQFTNAITITDTAGIVKTATWNFLGGSGTSSSNGYDFSFDPVTQTLAVSDAGNARVSIFKFGTPDPSTRLTWAANGVTPGGDGNWSTSGTTWSGAYGPEVWNPGAQAIFTGNTFPTSAVTVAPGGVSVGRGISFVTAGYTLGGGAITLAGTTASVNNLYVEPGVSATVNSGITSSAGLSKSGGGTLVVGGTISGGNVFVNNGTLQLASTGAIQPAALAGVSVLATGTLDVTALSGGYVVPAGTGLAGAGTVAGAVTVAANSVVSPGSNLGTLTVTGNTTLSSGGNYNWQVYDAAGTAGSASGWDLLSVGGGLTVAATSGNPFNINLWSLSGTSPDTNGNALNFSATTSGTWRIASAAGGITGFAADKFRINVSATSGVSDG